MIPADRPQRLSFLAAWDWFKTALAACRREPLSLAVIAVFYMSSMGLLSLLPLVGPLAASLFMPFGTVLLGRGVRETLAGRSPRLSLLGDVWRDAELRKNLVNIGLVFAVSLSTVNLLFDLLAAPDIQQWTTLENGRLDWSSARAHLPWTAIIVSLVIYLPTLAATWFAPLLASEKRMRCGKALFYSFFGALMSLGPILVLGILLAVVLGGATLLVTTIIAYLGLAGSEMFILVPFAFASSTVLYAVYWPMYVSLFDKAGR